MVYPVRGRYSGVPWKEVVATIAEKFSCLLINKAGTPNNIAALSLGSEARPQYITAQERHELEVHMGPKARKTA